MATKFGYHIIDAANFEIRGDPTYVRAACEGSLKRLNIDCIDLYYQHRVDIRVPIEVTVSCNINPWPTGLLRFLFLFFQNAHHIFFYFLKIFFLINFFFKKKLLRSDCMARRSRPSDRMT